MTIRDNAVRVLQQYLNTLRAPVTATTLEQTLTRHPHYPSLLAVSDGLHSWHIDHMTVRVKRDQLADVPTPFFTQLTVDEGRFTMVDSVSGGIVRWWHSEDGWQREPVSAFLPNWEPVVLVAQLSDKSGETDYPVKRRREQLGRLRKPLAWGSALICVLLTVVLLLGNRAGTMPWLWLALLLTKLTGTLVSIGLIRQANDPSANESALCRFHKTVDCNAVLNSRAATLWGGISWAEIGLCYFAGGSLALVMGLNDAFVQTTLWGLGLMALPYVLFSVYYQAWVLYKWCTWCLMVQALLITEALLLITTEPAWAWSPYGMARIGLGFLLPVVGWMLIRPTLTDARQKRELMQQLNLFRNDPQLFANQLHRQEQMPPLPDGLQPIVLGNPQADYVITLIINPFCGPCAKAVADAKAMVGTYPWLNCRILFTISTDETDQRTAFVRGLYALPMHERTDALASWLTMTDKDVAARRGFFDAETGEPEARQQVAMLRWWNENAAITVTPTIYVSGQKLPPHYAVTDLPYLIKYGLPGQPATQVSRQVEERV